MSRYVLDARTATDHFPGIGRYVVNLAHALRQVAPDMDFQVLHDPSATEPRLKLRDLPLIDCAVSPFSLQQQWRVRQVLRAANAAVYHSPYYLMPYRPGVPSIFTCHDLIPLICPQYFTATQRLIYRFTHQLALRTARVTIAVSRSTQHDLMQRLDAQPYRVMVIPEGVDVHFQPQPRSEIHRVRAKYALPAKVMLYFGSNKPHKNIVRLVQAFAELEARGQKLEVSLVIAGLWDARYNEAKQLVEERGLRDRVHFIGAVADDDLPALYSSATLFVFQSLYEGFGLPVLEAMACGTPVVCGGTSSLPEVTGPAALTFDPLNVEAIAAAIERLIDDADLRASLRQAGLARAAQFTWERVAEQTVEVYRAVASM
jgi:alpha-1,3-rhamnosyl/mannosyltransferase